MMMMIMMRLRPKPRRTSSPRCALKTPPSGGSYSVELVQLPPTSSDSRHALGVYKAALDDLETPAEDIKFLRSIFETERQADFDRANPDAYAAFTGDAYMDYSDTD